MANENNVQAEKKEKKPGRVAKFLKDLKSECKKIVWPSRQETVKKTSVVLVCLIAVAIVIGVMDFAFNKIVELLATPPSGMSSIPIRGMKTRSRPTSKKSWRTADCRI